MAKTVTLHFPSLETTKAPLWGAFFVGVDEDLEETANYCGGAQGAAAGNAEKKNKNNRRDDALA